MHVECHINIYYQCTGSARWCHGDHHARPADDLRRLRRHPLPAVCGELRPHPKAVRASDSRLFPYFEGLFTPFTPSFFEGHTRYSRKIGVQMGSIGISATIAVLRGSTKVALAALHAAAARGRCRRTTAWPLLPLRRLLRYAVPQQGRGPRGPRLPEKTYVCIYYEISIRY